LSTLRLKRSFRYAVYGAYAVLFVTGMTWFAADAFKDADGEFFQQLGAKMLMLHGGTAMVTLLFLGTLFPSHMRLAWRAGRNRVMGAVIIALNAALILTAFALYYIGSETFRPWMSNIHFYVGAIFPLLLSLHVVLGRRTS
jgi:hypothetical protein